MFIDCSLIKNRKGIDCIGRNHYDRGVTKISMLTDKNGIPIAIDTSPGNNHDVKLFLSTINNLLVDISKKNHNIL